MYSCIICKDLASYYVATPGSDPQSFCEDHMPGFLKKDIQKFSYVTKLSTEGVIYGVAAVEEEPVVEEPVVETPAPKTRKKAAATPVVEEPVVEEVPAETPVTE